MESFQSATTKMVTHFPTIALNVTHDINGSNIFTTTSTAMPVPVHKIPKFDIAIIAMCIPCFIVAVLGNLLVILVRAKKLRQTGLSAYKLMICHLSLADIIYSTAIPLDIYTKINQASWIESTAVCKIVSTSQSASLTASICIMTAMAFERFQGVSDPMRHHWSNKQVTHASRALYITK